MHTSTGTYKVNPVFFAEARKRTDAQKKICLSSYAYGFNGKEKDDEVKGTGNSYDYGARIYDSRLGKFLSFDPLAYKYAFYSPYHFAGNKPVVAIDVDGGEDRWIHAYEQEDGSFFVVNDGSKIENDITKSANAAMFGMPALKEGGTLYTTTNINGVTTVKEYIPDVTVKPGIMNAIVHELTHPTEKMEEAVGEIANRMQSLSNKMTGSMENYGVDEGDEGRQKWTERGHTAMDYLGKVPHPGIKAAAEIFDGVITLTEIAAEAEKGNACTATVIAVNAIADKLISGALEKVLPEKEAKNIRDKLLEEGLDQAIGTGMDAVKDKFLEKAKEADEKK